MNERRTPRRLLVGALLALPVAAGAVVGLVLVLGGERRTLIAETSLAGVVLLLGCIVSLSAGLVVLAWSVASSRIRSASDRGREEQRVEHRRFLARLDHELKNPVTAIRASVAAIPDAAGSPHLRAIDVQTRRLANLVGELRKLAELETVAIERESVDVEQVVQDAVAAVREQQAAAGPGALPIPRISLVFPQAPWPLPTIEGDPDLLFLAVYNVVGNAAKYSGPGAEIEIRGADDDGFVEIEVADTGRGVPVRDLPFVWDELARGENARGVPGSGLGLSLVRAIVQRHGGAVSMRSREGTGTSVRIRLPHRLPV